MQCNRERSDIYKPLFCVHACSDVADVAAEHIVFLNCLFLASVSHPLHTLPPTPHPQVSLLAVTHSNGCHANDNIIMQKVTNCWLVIGELLLSGGWWKSEEMIFDTKTPEKKNLTDQLKQSNSDPAIGIISRLNQIQCLKLQDWRLFWNWYYELWFGCIKRLKVWQILSRSLLEVCVLFFFFFFSWVNNDQHPPTHHHKISLFLLRLEHFSFSLYRLPSSYILFFLMCL